MPKTTFKVRTKRWDIFNRECKAMSIRRDSFLDRALPGEIVLLAQIQPCDFEGERWLKKTWVERWDSKDYELKPVPIFLSENVIDQINTTCLEKLVPRDAFIDCALAFFVQRLYEPAVVIKDPRTTKDTLAQLAQVFNDGRDEIEDLDRERFVSVVVQKLLDSRDIQLLDTDIYKTRLSLDAGRVATEKLTLESLSLLTNSDLKAKKVANNTKRRKGA